MKKAMFITGILVFCLVLFSSAQPAQPYTNNKVNLALENGKDTTIYVLREDENSKVYFEVISQYEHQLKQRQEPITNEAVEDLTKKGVSLNRAKEYTTGDYEDFLLAQPINDNDKKFLMERFGKTGEELASWTVLDRENFYYELNKGLQPENYSSLDQETLQGYVDNVNSLGLTYAQAKTLGNMGFSYDEVGEMTYEEASSYLGLTTLG